MKRLQYKVVLALLALSAAASADEYPYLDYKMLHTRDDPFRYYVDSRDPRPAGIDLAQVELATQAAFQTWENVAEAYPDFQYMGKTSTQTAINPNNVGDPLDAFNVSTVWVTSNTDPYYSLALGSGQGATGAVPLTYAGYLYQCDIFINAVRFRWTTVANTDPKDGFTDLQTALTHEVGHCLGLGDVYSPTNAVMHAVLPVGGSRRFLDAHDQQHISGYYPENGAVGSPCSTSDPCAGTAPLCIPRLRSDGGVQYRYCSKSCPNVSPGECPDPFVCRQSPIRDGGTVCSAVPNEAITQVGKPCGTDPECGSAVGICQQELPLPSTGTAWQDGYCQENCTLPGGNTCPAGSVCVDFPSADRCLKSCRVGGGDCRPGYTCAPRAEGNVCVPNCYTDQDCPNNYFCRVCDRVCIQNTGPGKSVGDKCSVTSECGVGQVCLFINNLPEGVCALPCSNATCSCPAGSQCKPVGSKLMCMKDCSSGTCVQGLTCNPLGNSYSCVPPCRSGSDCPSGWFCSGGTCIDPVSPPDAGCTLCSDGGGQPPPPPPPVDGGLPGDDTPDGCGCSGGPGSALLFFGVIALLLLVGGRHSWSRR
jgi:MYXO-CTERM domain-containing protein